MTTAMSPANRQALLQALREDQDFREEARALLLCQEVLNLPKQVAALNERLDEFIAAQKAANAEQREFNAAQREFNRVVESRLSNLEIQVGGLTERVDGLTTQVGGLTEQVGGLTEQVDGLNTRVDDLTEQVGGLTTQVGGLNERVDGLTTQVGGLNERVDGLTNRVGTLLGSDLENQVQGSIHSLIFRHLAFTSTHVLKSRSVHPAQFFHNFLMDAIDQNRINHEDVGQLLAADLLLRARLPDSTEQVHIAVEVSRTIADDDIVRARERADLLAAAAGTAGQAVVIGVIIPEPQRRLAERLGVAVFQEEPPPAG